MAGEKLAKKEASPLEPWREHSLYHLMSAQVN
jgi:hypothetical protein